MPSEPMDTLAAIIEWIESEPRVTDDALHAASQVVARHSRSPVGTIMAEDEVLAANAIRAFLAAAPPAEPGEYTAITPEWRRNAFAGQPPEEQHAVREVEVPEPYVRYRIAFNRLLSLMGYAYGEDLSGAPDDFVREALGYAVALSWGGETWTLTDECDEDHHTPREREILDLRATPVDPPTGECETEIDSSRTHDVPVCPRCYNYRVVIVGSNVAPCPDCSPECEHCALGYVPGTDDGQGHLLPCPGCSKEGEVGVGHATLSEAWAALDALVATSKDRTKAHVVAQTVLDYMTAPQEGEGKVVGTITTSGRGSAVAHIEVEGRLTHVVHSTAFLALDGRHRIVRDPTGDAP